MSDAIEQIAELLAADFGPRFTKQGNALLLQMRTEKYRNFEGEAVCHILIFVTEGNLTFLCPEFLKFTGGKYPLQTVAACLELQARGNTAVQFQLIPGREPSGLNLATCVKLPLGDKVVTGPHLRHCILDLSNTTDQAYEYLREFMETGGVYSTDAS